ncbi:ATP-binding protein [Rhodococcoides corynebacterioides]|uniref:ATP-binding protein n=1 Tax=Rhodococcoides corynebacterioides TaxID=53972 RepID=UPI001C9AAF17|nr:ATP-binding protein [Rhodococcus corynebacterioides]MBY6349152.1 ATP-binding protein [Rhodococcus corynebacterioides]MBY6361487.1 ATP-binding protein [Rhodococcus corynebacterioides]
MTAGFAQDTHTSGASPAPELALNDLPAEPRRLSSVRTEVQRWLEDHGIDDDRCHDITLATYEALANSVEHAYCTEAVDADTCTVTLYAVVTDDRTVAVDVADHGRWMDHEDDPRRGRGLPLIHALADHATVDTSPTGTVVKMRWHL